MNWNSNSIILSIIDSGESGSVVLVFSENYGKWRGFSNLKRNRKVSVGDICYTEWGNRTDDGLGNFKLELIYSPYQYNFLLNSNLLAIQSACQLLNIFLADRDKHSELYKATEDMLQNMSLKNYALWELKLLQHIGYGLDFSRCVVTGQRDGLYYISPKTGHCVIKAAGEAYKEHLFVIPNFWHDDGDNIDEINESLRITGYFISKITEHSLFYRKMLITRTRK